MKDRKILVTGAAGLIGRNIIAELNQSGFDNIVAVDNLRSNEKWMNLRAVKFRDYYEKDDFMEKVKTGYLSEFSHVVHLGACSSTTEKDATYLIKNNYEYTKILAEFCMKNNIRFLYASSAATYGEGEHGFDDKADIDPLQPLNMYGYSKQLFDLHAKREGFMDKITGLKYFNIFGYGEFHKGEMRSVVLKGYEQIKQTGQLKLFRSYREDYGDGEQKRDFLSAKDAAKMTLHLLFGENTGLFNIGHGQARTWNDLAAAIFSALRTKTNIEYIEMPDYLIPKYQYYTCADMEKFNSTGYKKTLSSLEDSVAEYIQKLELKNA